MWDKEKKMSEIKKIILDYFKKKYEAEFEHNKTQLTIYLKYPVAVGEHPKHLDDMDVLIGKMAEARDKLKIVHEMLEVKDEVEK